jgi:hypothetical protein
VMPVWVEELEVNFLQRVWNLSQVSFI